MRRPVNGTDATPAIYTGRATMSTTTKIPAIAIHGVGNHKPGEIRDALEQNLSESSGFDLTLHEFNWDQFVDQSRWKTKTRGAIWLLETTSFAIQTSGIIGIAASHGGLDKHLSSMQLLLCSVLRYAVAFFLTLFAAYPAVWIMVFLPSILAQISSAIPAEGLLTWLMSNVIPPAIHFIGAVCAAILLVGIVRCIAQWSLIPLRASFVGVALIILNPILVCISVLVSLPWAAISFVVLFFSAIGLIFLLLDWILPDAGPVMSIWDNYWLASYFLKVIAIIIALQLLNLLLKSVWFQGPIKVVLDIFRYLAEPGYRNEKLSRLNAFITSVGADAQTVVLIAHSLGSVIALDYLLNFADEDPERDIWLVTLGSPYRRFFLSLFPGILVHRNTDATAAAVARKFHSFRWLNIYRPWDPIGGSLKLKRASSGLDVSTGQYRKINGHTGYWSDPSVMEAAKMTFAFVREPGTAHEDKPPPIIPPRIHLAAPSKNWLYISHFLFVGLGIAWMVYSIAIQASQIEAMQQRVYDQGLSVKDVLVTHQRIPDIASNRLYGHQFEFSSASVSNLPTIQISPFLPASRAQRLFDFRKLMKHIRSDCELEQEDTFWTDDDNIRCTSKRPIELAYIPGAAEPELHLPEFEAKVYLRDMDGWILFPLALFFIASLPGIPFTLITAGVFLVLLGRRVDENVKPMLKEFEASSS